MRPARRAQCSGPARATPACHCCGAGRWRTGAGSFQQVGSACGFFDTLVVLGFGFDEAAGSLQIENRLLLRVGWVKVKEGLFDLRRQRRVEAAAHSPVVVEIGRRGREHVHLAGIDLAAGDQFVPHAGIEHAGIDLAGLNPGSCRVMCAGIGNAAEEGLRLDVFLEHEIARHQAAGSGRHRAEGKRLAFQISQSLHGRIGGDEFAGEFGVLLALYQRHGISGLEVDLNKGEAAQPGHVEAVGGQCFDHGRVIRYRHELDFHAQALLQISPQRLELAQQFGGRLVGDGRDAQGIGRMAGQRGEGQGKAGGERQGTLEHGSFSGSRAGRQVRQRVHQWTASAAQSWVAVRGDYKRHGEKGQFSASLSADTPGGRCGLR
ncbi:hypothetical protein ALP99_05167 [Pseudomonas syringae pv. tomato]|nr:hypothetical protein ALP99_05167 [Pseudomonas syringae pv. tomato]